MCECDCISKHSSIVIDEDRVQGWNLREQTERKKTMSRKIKIWVSALVMSVTLVVISMAVLAADVERVDRVVLNAAGTGTATIGIRAYNTYAYAKTSGGAEVIYTTITGYGDYPDTGSGTRSASAEGYFEMAESHHQWLGSSYSMIIYAE